MNRIHAKVAALFLALAMVLGLAGCGVCISGLSLPADLVLEKGETRQMSIQYSTQQEVSTPEMAKAAEKLALTWPVPMRASQQWITLVW